MAFRPCLTAGLALSCANLISIVYLIIRQRLVFKQGNNVVPLAIMSASLLQTVEAQRFLKKRINDFSWYVLWQYQPIMFFAGLRLFL
ncbi:MAG: hypothetical protein ACI8PB_005274 [Desulforhopalus sp.]